MNGDLIKIELTTEEASLYRHLREQRVFEICNGNVTIHFDKDKKVSLIDVHTYKRL